MLFTCRHGQLADPSLSAESDTDNANNTNTFYQTPICLIICCCLVIVVVVVIVVVAVVIALI